MIDMGKWSELMGEWARVAEGPIDKVVYQVPSRIKARLEHFNEHCLPHLKDKKVVELGCNAGIFGYHIDKVSKSYLGVEPGQLIASKKKKSRTDYYKQAQITQKHMSGNAKFLNATVADFASVETNDYEALVMCFVLYHLSDKEIKLLIKKVLPKCDVVVIQNRVQKRPTKHNSHKFWKSKNIVKFLSERGFTTEVISGIKFDEIIGKKPVKKIETKPTMSQETKEKDDKIIKELKKDVIPPKEKATAPIKMPIINSVNEVVKDS